MAMTREEFARIYQQWLATSPQVQQAQAQGTGDNESYQPGGTQNYVDFNGQRINLGNPGQGAQGDFQFGTPDDYGQADGTTQYSSANATYDPSTGFSPDLNWKQNYHGNSNIDHLIQNLAIAAGVGGAAYGLSGAGAAAGAGGASGGTSAGMAGAGAAGEAAGAAGEAAGAAGIGGSTIGQAMSGAEVVGGGLSGAQAAGGAATAGGIAGSGTGTAGAGGGLSGQQVAGSLAPLSSAMNAGSMSPDGSESQLADAYGQPYNAGPAADRSLLDYVRKIPGMENMKDADLMRVAASLGLGAVSAAGPSSQTTRTESGNDPATDAYLAQIRARATGLADKPLAPTPSVTTSTAGVQSAVEDFRPAQQVQNTWLNESNDLVRQGTTPGVAAQNGLLGAVRSMMADSTAPRTATANVYAGQNNPFTQQAVDYAAGDMNRAYANNVAPKFASGSSYGSSGLGFAEVMARDDLLRRQGQMFNDMRSKDLTAQQRLAEEGATRQDNIDKLRSELLSTNANNLGTFGSQNAQRADNMYTNNADRSLTGATQIANNSQIPIATATTIANAQGNLWGLNDNNTIQATDAYRWGQDYPLRQQEMLVNSTGRGGTTGSTTTPNGNAASRFVGGTLAGWQGWNNLTQPRSSTNTGRPAI